VGETCIDALRREIKEETNLRYTRISFVLAQDSIHSKDFYRDAHFILLNYTCRCREEPEVRLNDEASAFRWVTIRRSVGNADQFAYTETAVGGA
jgi:ADP-ribose pyrophosphatase YjhB (NUDIX family)